MAGNGLRANDMSRCPEWIVAFSVIFLWISDVSRAQECATGQGKTLVQSALINHHDVNTCDDVSDYSDYVSQFMDACSLSSVPVAATLGKCTRQCVTDSSCAAISYTSSEGCRACLDTTADGSNSAALSLDTTLIAVEKLKEFIDGKRLRKVFNWHYLSNTNTVTIGSCQLNTVYWPI